jgi:tetratricopeptide (TPR) repeat protein
MTARVLLLSAALTVLAVPASAADKILFGSPPAWVNAEQAPEPPPKNSEAPIEVLLTASQVRLEPASTSVYSETAIRIQQPAGLQAGSLALQWSPDFDEITVHKVIIRRAGKDIDVLAGGKGFEIVRREQNLEQAVLDGRLTAILQPEGLRVGDILHVASTTVHREPVFGSHSELISGMLPGISARRARLLVEWPATMAMRFRPNQMGEPMLGKRGDLTTAEWQLDDAPSLILPKNAPGRFLWGRQVEFTDAASWSDVARLMAPLYERASVIPKNGPLRAELERIRGASPSPVVRAQAALRLVEDQVRYVALQMGMGGLVPAAAETTWSRRFGDCKAKTALLLGLLHELGIAAVPVAVNAQNGDGLDARLPMVALFDHVLVRATINGRDYWLDGTRSGDPRLDLIDTPAFGWGLPLMADAKLVRMIPAPAARPTEETSIRMDARKGGSAPAPTSMEVVFRGDSAIAMNLLLTSLPAETRQQALKNFWEDRLSDVEVKSTDTSFNRDEGEYRLTMTGTAKLDLKQGRYWVDVPTPGYKPDFDRQSTIDREAPFAQDYPSYTRHRQTILIADEIARIPLNDTAPIDRTVAGVHYRRTAEKKGNTFTIDTSAQTLAPEFSYAVARASEKELRGLDQEDFYVVLDRPKSEEIDKLLTKQPETAEDLIGRGAMLAWSGRFKESVADYDQALAKEPNNAAALEGRGFSRAQLGELKLARADYEAAAKQGSKVPFLHVLAANEAMERKDWAAALSESGKAIAMAPNQPEMWMVRAEVNKRADHSDAALYDADQAIRRDANFAPAYLFRINVFGQRHQADLAIAEADKMMKLSLSDAFGYVAAGKTYATYDRPEAAKRAFDKAIETKAEAYIYLNRAQTRPQTDIAARKADILAGLKLEPGHPDSLIALATIQADAGEREDAAATLQKLSAKDADDVYMRISRGIVYAKLGQAARAEADFAFVRAEAEQNADVLNYMCWEKATANVALESALVDCDRAIVLSPTSNGTHDSRGLVLLRLGRLDEALAAYNRAMADKRESASSLYGRALVWARKGDKRRAAQDLSAAEKLSPRIRERYASYGLKL